MPLKGVGTWEEAGELHAEQKKKKSGGFQSMDLAKPLLDGVLKMGYSVPTPIQRKAIPPMMQGLDCVAMARTGSGKSAAFIIPLLHHLKEHSKTVGIRGLIFSPTRELALQILRHTKSIGRFTNLRCATLVGGNSLDSQFEALAGNPDIVVASPGRLLHIMEESGMQLSLVRMLILDEADRLFEQGLQPQIVALLQKIPEGSQRALFSATMPSVLAEFTSAGLHNPAVIRLDTETKLSEKLSTSTFVCRSEEKLAALMVLLKKTIKVTPENQALVFVESKHHVDMMEMVMENYGIPAAAIHGQMDQEARRLAVQAFAKKRSNVMIVTDVAARGIDLPLLDNVINYSFPFTPKLFVHRVGRVARAGRTGSAYNIITTDDMPYYIDLMKFIERPLQCTIPQNDLLFNVKDGCYGRLVQEDVSLELDYLRRLMEHDIEIGDQWRTSNRAHEKYTKTKKKATRGGKDEAREGDGYRLDEIPIHPMLLQALDSKVISSDAAKWNLRNFKAAPGESFLDMVHGVKVFNHKYVPTKKITDMAGINDRVAADVEKATAPIETVVSVNRRQNAALAAISDAPPKKLTLAESMLQKAQDRKRKERDATEDDVFEMELAAAAAQSANKKKGGPGGGFTAIGGSGSRAYQDSEFFMSNIKEQETIENTHYSVKDATMDVQPETAGEMHAQRNVFAWNDRKNRYQKMHVNDAKAMLKGIKNEAGKAINFKTKLEMYSKWLKTSNMRIQDCGEEEDLAAVTKAKAARHGDKDELDDDDEDKVDISDPNAGKKVRISKKRSKNLTSDGHVRNFQEMAEAKNKKEKQRAKDKGKGGKKKKKK